jgi:poly(A) polymerase
MPIRHKIAEHVTEIIEALQKAGYESYLVGGAVRDLLLGLQPKDYDISTAATPEQIKHLFGRRKVMIIGKRFRLAHYYHGHEIIEISTFRRKPEKAEPVITLSKKIVFHDNEFGTSYEDAFRRDFTINAIFYDPVKNAIVDYSEHGMKDLKSGIVRIIGDPAERFTEDPVRILRALKLVGQYGFKICPDTEKEMIAKMHLIANCSHSRLSLEFEKVLKKTSSVKMLKTLNQYGFLQYFLPFFHEYWETPECQTMLKLLELRNSRVESGLHRNSLSIAVAVMTFPFVAAAMSKSEDGSLWKYYSGLEKDIKKIMLGVLHPHSFSKRLIESAVFAILLQTAIQKNRPHRRVAKHPRYPHAVELQEILKQSGMAD